jgi:small subunit ribosomal protein S9
MLENKKLKQEKLVSKKQELEQYYATGRRKSSVARVFLRPGKGEIKIRTKNHKTYTGEEFLGKDTIWVSRAFAPLKLLEVSDQFDIYATVSGGGITGQAEALCLGIARSLDLVEQAKLTAQGVDFEENHESRAWHIALRKAGYLTRDARAVLRKLYGLVKARKAKQFSKR